MLVAVAVGSFSVILGLLVSYHHDTAASATMALVAVTIFLIVLSATELQRWLAIAHASPAPEVQ